ncbi:MAG: putative bifunctional diguanylate cyclase/phosphodiesterase [Actinomycetota bacterium]
MGAPDIRGEAVPAPLRDALARLVGEGWSSVASEVLAVVGEGVGADRAYVFQNVRGSDGRLWMDLRGEWDAPGVRQIFDDERNHLHPYFPDFGTWIDHLGAGGHYRGPVQDLDERARAVLVGEGVRSLLVLPVSAGGEWWGFVGLDAVRECWDWLDGDVAALRAFADAVAAAEVRDRSQTDLRDRDDLHRQIVEHGPAVLYVDQPDAIASTVYISPQIEWMLGYTPEEWYADPDLWTRILHPDDRARVVAENVRHNETGEPFSLEYRMFAKDGRVVWVLDEATMQRDERGLARFSHGVMMDVSDRKRTEEQLAFRAYHDELTGLPSRAMFEELLELSIARARRHEGAVAVLCVDLDDFRLVNDSLGHRHGDELLHLVAERLREATRETDLVARRGGDQFLMLLADLDRDEIGLNSAAMRSRAVAERIHESLAPAFHLSGTEVYVSASIGVAAFPYDAEDATTLQRTAEAAMYEAKKVGPSNVVSAGAPAVDSSAKLQLVTRLRKAVESQRWVLHYQPVLELDSGRMVGVEALIRWIEPDGSIIPPVEFIPLAEELGLIEQIGDWVVREISYQVQAWRELDIDLEVGFNLSPRQFWQPDLAERIMREFRLGGVEPSKVMVEVTESSAMMDPDRAQEILSQLHETGFAIAIDDFGTGYSSLSRLREMPVKVLKIDRSFVSNVHEDPQAASIVAAFLELARGLGMTTLAEGIETVEELAFLRERGCTLGQGFYFSRAVAPEEIIAYAFGGIPSAAGLVPLRLTP